MAKLLAVLPPPTSHAWPFPDVEALLALLARHPLPPPPPPGVPFWATDRLLFSSGEMGVGGLLVSLPAREGTTPGGVGSSQHKAAAVL